MDSYTDVSGQCCGHSHRHMSCNTSGQNTCSSCRLTDYPDMNTLPWGTENDYGTSPAYSYMNEPYQNMNDAKCVSTAPTCLEQQYPVAMAYVPWQQWQSTYAPERALVQGTIFPELDLQFNYGRCGR